VARRPAFERFEHVQYDRPLRWRRVHESMSVGSLLPSSSASP
jgi:hypothetical protein